MTDQNQPLAYIFDYGDIKPEHKEAATEITNLLRSQGQEMLAEMIKLKFKLVEIPKYNMDSSPFVAACKEAGLYCGVQGYLQEGEEPNIIQYPVVSICDDIRRLEKLIPVIKSMELNEGNQ